MINELWLATGYFIFWMLSITVVNALRRTALSIYGIQDPKALCHHSPMSNNETFYRPLWRYEIFARCEPHRMRADWPDFVWSQDEKSADVNRSDVDDDDDDDDEAGFWTLTSTSITAIPRLTTSEVTMQLAKCSLSTTRQPSLITTPHGALRIIVLLLHMSVDPSVFLSRVHNVTE